jgi:hypothetical protein
MDLRLYLSGSTPLHFLYRHYLTSDSFPCLWQTPRHWHFFCFLPICPDPVNVRCSDEIVGYVLAVRKKIASCSNTGEPPLFRVSWLPFVLSLLIPSKEFLMNRLFRCLLAVAFLGWLGVSSAQAQLLQKVSGALNNRQGHEVGTFRGQLNVQGIDVNDAGELLAFGQLSGDLVNKGGQVIRSIQDVPVTLPLSGITTVATDPNTGAITTEATTDHICRVAELTLGPLDLNLLGLLVHLDQVHLTIDANPAGGLLGELLCSLAGGPGTITELQGLTDALDNLGVTLDQLVGVLNELLGVL